MGERVISYDSTKFDSMLYWAFPRLNSRPVLWSDSSINLPLRRFPRSKSLPNSSVYSTINHFLFLRGIPWNTGTLDPHLNANYPNEAGVQVSRPPRGQRRNFDAPDEKTEKGCEEGVDLKTSREIQSKSRNIDNFRKSMSSQNKNWFL